MAGKFGGRNSVYLMHGNEQVIEKHCKHCQEGCSQCIGHNREEIIKCNNYYGKFDVVCLKRRGLLPTMESHILMSVPSTSNAGKSRDIDS